MLLVLDNYEQFNFGKHCSECFIYSLETRIWLYLDNKSSDMSGYLSRAIPILCANMRSFPTGDRNLFNSPVSISEGPVGQSVLTTGVLRISDSISTVGRPSLSDDIVNRSAFLIHGYGFV